MKRLLVCLLLLAGCRHSINMSDAHSVKCPTFHYTFEEGAVTMSCSELETLIAAGRHRYADVIDPAGLTYPTTGLQVHFVKPLRILENGQPEIDLGGEHVVAYFSSMFNTIYLADGHALDHEVIHWLDYSLHGDVSRAIPGGANGASVLDGQATKRYQILEHWTVDDPFRIKAEGGGSAR